MFCLFFNSFIYLFNKDRNFFYFNYFLIKNYNLLFYYFLFNNNNINNKKLLLNKTVNFSKKNFKYKNYFFLYLTKYINFFLVKEVYYQHNSFINSMRLGNNVYFSFNTFFLKFFKSFYNMFYYLVFNNYNYLILDCEYKFVFPLYNYIFEKKDLVIYKDFFFLKPKVFTYKQWLYFYSHFLKTHNVSLLIIFDYLYYFNYLSDLNKIDIAISSIVPINYTDFFIDYPLYASDINFSFNKLLFYSIISQITFLAISNKNLQLKLKYLLIFYKFAKI
jgi:hypothetical protein